MRALLVVTSGASALACAGGLARGQPGGVASTLELRQVTYPPSPHHVVRAAPDEPDGTKLLYLDGWRMLHQGSRVELAEQVTIDTLQRSCHSGRGWMHVSHRGHVYWSSTFLGNLKLLGKASDQGMVQCGPQLVTAGSPPELWTETGPQPLTYSAPIGRAHFKTRLQGSAWAFPDLWLTTSDGGKTFSRSPAPGSPELFQTVPTELPEIGETELGLALRAWLERAVKSGAGRVMDGLRLSDGTWVRTGGIERERYAALRSPDGRITTVTARGDCGFSTLGSQLLTRCQLEDPVDTLVVDVVYPQGAKLVPPPRALRRVITDAEGRFLFAQSRLSEGRKERVLLRFDGKAWQEFPQIASEPQYSRHGWLVLKDPLRVVPAEHPEQEPRLLPANVRSDELDLLQGSIVFVQRDEAEAGTSELVELDLRTGKTTSRTPFPGAPGALAFSDTGLAVAMAEGSGDALHMIAGRHFSPLSLQADPYFGPPDSAVCWTDGCSVGEVMAWSHVPSEQEPLVIPTEGRPKFEPGEDTTDVGFSMPDYQCDTVSPPPRPDEELLGIAKGSSPSTEEIDETAPLAAISAYGGQLDLSPTPGAGPLGWHGQDREGAFRVRLPASQALRTLAARLPRYKGGDAALLPSLLARHFALFDNAVDTDDKSQLLIVREDGETEELVPLGNFDFDAVPLPDGRALVSANFETHRDVMLLDRDGKLSQRRYFLLGVRSSDSLALRGDTLGMLFADENAPLFFTLAPQSAGTPVTLPKFRKTEPCRTRSPRDAVTLILTAMPRLTVAGFTGPSRLWLSPTWDSQNGEVAFVETTPSKPCLRSVLLDAPIATELVSSAPWLHGRMQGQTKSYPLICKAVPAAPPRDSPALELLLSEEEEAARPRPQEDE